MPTADDRFEQGTRPRDRLHARALRAVQGGLALAILAGALPASAQTWQVDYDANRGSLPSAQGWTYAASDPPPVDGLSEADYAVASGVLVQSDSGGVSADPGNAQSYRISPPGYDFERDDVVVDLRLRIVSSGLQASGPGASAGFTLSVTDRDRAYVRLHVGSTGLFLRGSGNSALVPFDTTNALADYQLRLGKEGASLWLNGLEVGSLDRSSFGRGITEATAGLVVFGDVSNTQSSSSEVEHVRIARFNPVEPEVRAYQVVTAFSATDSASSKNAVAACPTHTNAIGGGVTTIGADGSVAISASRPTPAAAGSATAWYGEAREISATGEAWQLRVDVLCGQVAGYVNVDAPVPSLFDANQTQSVQCPAGSFLLGGGGEVAGPDLNQALLATGFVAGFPPGSPPSWFASARDNGVTTSPSPWQVRPHAICTQAQGFEIVTASSPQDGLSPKGATANCPGGKVPIAGSAAISGHMNVDGGLRLSRPKFSPGETNPVGWIASAQSDSSLWNLDVRVVCAPIADPTVSKTGLVSRWQAESTADDSWGWGHGQLHNGAGFESGVDGFGFSLDPTTDQWVEVSSYYPSNAAPSTGLFAEGSFTVEAWFRSTAVATAEGMEIFNLVDSGGLNGTAEPNLSRWAIRLSSDGYASTFFADRFGIGGHTQPPVGTTDLRDGEIHHFVLMRDLEDRRARVYIDGEFLSETSVNSMINDGPLLPSAPGEPVAIGIWRDGFSTNLRRGFDGMIDDLKYYDRALSEEEIRNTAGCALPILPRVLNVDAQLFGTEGTTENRLCVFLEAGSYRVTLVNPALEPDARMTAWSASPDAPWSTLFSIDAELDPGATGGSAANADDPDQAFDETLVRETTFTLTADQRVHFSVLDPHALDNRGGVSLRLEPVPEPAFALALASGVGLLAATAKRRKRARQGA